MKTRMNKGFARGISIVMSLMMAISAVGCGKTQEDTTSTETSTVQADQESAANKDATDDQDTEANKNAAPAAKIDDNGKPIIDFDEFVNGEWKAEQEAKNIGSYSVMDEMNDKVNIQVANLLIDTNLDELSEDDGIYKAIYFYNQLLKGDDNTERVATIKKHLAPIEDINSFEDLYELYKDPEYAIYNGILRYEVRPDDQGYNMLFFCPRNYLTGLEDSESLVSYLSYLGYSDKEARRIIDNSKVIGQILDDYAAAFPDQEHFYYFDQETLTKAGVTVPAFDILKELDSFGRYEEVLSNGDFCGLLNKIYQPENLEALRDYYLFSAAYRFAFVSGHDFLSDLTGEDRGELAFDATKALFADVLNVEYKKRYLDEENIKMAEDLTEDIKNILRDTLSDADWLSVHGKELAKHKMMIMRESFGGNQDENLLTEVTMGDDVVENYVALLESRQNHFRKQTIKEDDKRELFDIDPFVINAIYESQLTLLYVTSPMLSDERCSKDVSYEERVAYLGRLIAHELSHTYDPKGINYDYHGYKEPWMTEDEAAAYAEKIQKITDFFEGKEIANGLKIDGKQVTQETFADILATRCCLKLLEKQENPDYDLFFRAAAKFQAHYYTEGGLTEALKDTHLPDKERVNYVLGQFDKFYEIYDIDESSPYFVPESERLQAIF
ncbi:MAG: hypothetical protein K6F75_07335 [Butyrivibrio sp.]|nr:hypothetical protein [Butyrivibrio sp.]